MATIRCRSVLPPVINTVAIIPYFVVAAVDMSGYRNTALIIHYIPCIIDPPYTVMGALYFISITTTIAMLLYGYGGERARWPIYRENTNAPRTAPDHATGIHHQARAGHHGRLLCD